MAKKKLTAAQKAAARKKALAAAKKKAAAAAREKAWNIAHRPKDWARGSSTPGKDYYAWKTHSGKKPDFGKKAGPGDPYREQKKKIPKYIKPKPPKYTPPKSKTKPPPARPIPSKPTPAKPLPPKLPTAPKPASWVSGSPRGWTEGKAADFKSQAIERRLRGVK